MSGKGQKGSRRVRRAAYGAGGHGEGWRQVAEEAPVAFSFHGTTHAVMMATPADLEDFAIGFCLNEDIISAVSDVVAMEPVGTDGGIDMQIKLKDDVRAKFQARRRSMAGPVGCGLCGVESIEEALCAVPDVTGRKNLFSQADITRAARLLSQHQPLNMETRAVHAAGFYTREGGIVFAREDVGRHNALDKLIGALARAGTDGKAGAVVVTSRVSLEMVQKTACLGAPLLIAISAPTALALEVAEKAGITVAALVRGDEFELFTHAERISGGQSSNVA